MIKDKKLLFKQAVIDSCPLCESVGNACKDCLKKMVGFDRYNMAGIPFDYWLKDFDGFVGNAAFKDFVLDYIINIEKHYALGTSLCFAGGIGRGKTFGACAILKKAAELGYECLYENMGLMVAKMKEDSYFKFYLMKVNFLVIDEVDSRFLPQSQAAIDFISSSLETILRNRYQNLMPTIICTNEEDGNISKGFNDIFQMVFESLKKQYIKTFFVGGKDFRKQ